MKRLAPLSREERSLGISSVYAVLKPSMGYRPQCPVVDATDFAPFAAAAGSRGRFTHRTDRVVVAWPTSQAGIIGVRTACGQIMTSVVLTGDANTQPLCAKCEATR